MTVLRAAAAVAVLWMAAAAQASAAARSTYPIALTRGSRLLVQARVNGHPVEALLDSAAEMSCVDPQFARELQLSAGETVSGQGSGHSSFDADLARGVSLEVFGITLKNQSVAVVDLADVGTRLLGRRLELRSLVIAGKRFADVAAVIDAQPSAADLNVGISVLRHFLITTDFAAHAVWLEPRTETGGH